jgi:hypothetical protein
VQAARKPIALRPVDSPDRFAQSRDFSLAFPIKSDILIFGRDVGGHVSTTTSHDQACKEA